MKMRLFLLFSVLVASLGVYSQRLRVGDTLPAQLLREVSGPCGFADATGKWIIIDFWQTSCKACLRSFPKLDSLQQAFGDFVQLLLVNNETRDSTQRFFKQRPHLQPHHVPMLMEDSLLTGLFPRDYAPWVVWIDPELRVRYITEGGSLTAANLALLLAGKVPPVQHARYKGIALIRAEKE